MEMKDLQALGLDDSTAGAVLGLIEKDMATRKAEYEFEDRLESAIQRYKGRNSKAIRAMLDLDKLRGSDRQEQDIDDALFDLRNAEGYLFEPVELPPPYAAGTGTAAVWKTCSDDVARRRAMGQYGRVDDGFVSELNGQTAPPRNLDDMGDYV